MAAKFIYFVFRILFICSISIEAYFLNDDLGTNLPDRFGDPIDENWQDKRSIENEYSNSPQKYHNFPSIDKESADVDYRNGNAETKIYDEQTDTLHKRESAMDEVQSYFSI